MSEEKTIPKSELLTTRPAEFEDLAFIYSTWLKGLRWGNDYYRTVNQDAYFHGQHRVIDDILKRPDIEVMVVCTKDELGVIVAYAVYSADTLYWVHCKKDWRGSRLGVDLIPKTIKSVNNFTRVGLSILKKYPGVIINPYA